jgi:hypothetical protein
MEPGGAGASLRMTDNKTAVQPESSSLSLFPNPVTSALQVRMGDPAKDALVTVTSNNGIVVRVQRITSASHTVSFDSLPAGVYYVTVRNGGRETTRIIIKQ